MKQRILCLLVVFSLLFAILPVTLAAEGETDETAVAVSGEEKEKKQCENESEEKPGTGGLQLSVQMPVCGASSGTCGKNVTYTISESGVLTIEGTGPMSDYTSGSAPWYAERSIITSAVIQKGVTAIGTRAFEGCTNLASVSLPEGVTSIGSGAFAKCTLLKSVRIPDGVSAIAASLFDGCTALESVALPGSVKVIYRYAFNNCTALKSVTLPEGLETVCDYVFSGCTSLECVTIPKSVTNVREQAFEGCTSLTSVYADDGNAKYRSIGGMLYEVTAEGLTLNCCPRGKTGAVTLPDGVTGIGKYAFYGNSALSSVSLPAGLTAIEEYAFCGCTGLTSVVLPEGTKTVGQYAFYECSNLRSVTVPDSVTSFSYYTFAYCSSLTSVRIPESETIIADGMFKGCSSLVSVTIPNGVVYIYKAAFQNCTSLKSVSIPESVIHLDKETFSYCTSLTSVTVPGSVKTLYPDMFYACTSLTSVTLGEGVENIGTEAFRGCTALNTVKLPGSLKSIANRAFYCCSSLASVSIPGAVSTIDDYAFYGCIRLASVTIPGSVADIGDYAFYGCSALSSAVIENGVRYIGEYAFYDCESLAAVKLPGSLESIAYASFGKCRSLREIEIGQGVKIIENGAFAYCDSLVSVKIPEGVTEIWDYAFAYGYALKRVSLPESMEIIWDYAFLQCSALTDVYYAGTAAAWSNIEVYSGNSSLTAAMLHCGTEGPVMPAVPANLTASNKSAGVFLTWNTVETAEGYEVCRDGVQIATSSAASYTDDTAKSGTVYNYTVKAVASGECSEASAEAKIMYLSVPANLKCTNGSEGITVTWGKVEGATGYTLYRRLSSSDTWTAVFTSTKATTLSKLDTGVTDGKTYYYTVRANYKSTDGNTKYYSSKATTGTKIVCSLVSTLAAPTVKSIVNGFSSILVKWSKVTGAEGYYVYRKAENGSTWTKLKTVKQPASGSTVSFGNTTPKNGETYTYKVVAYKGTALSPDSNEKTYMRMTCPTLTAKSTTAGKISFSWTDNEYATSFQIEYTTADTFTGATRKTLTAYKTSTTYSGFETGAEYHVRVRAYRKYWNEKEGKYMFYYGTWSSADATGASTQSVKVK